MSEVERETVERVRRIETRITKIGNALGVDVGGGKAFFSPAGDGRVTIPSPNCSIGDVLRAIPKGRQKDEIDVYVGETYLMTVFVDPDLQV